MVAALLRFAALLSSWVSAARFDHASTDSSVALLQAHPSRSSSRTRGTCSSVPWGDCQPDPNTGSCQDHLNWAITHEKKTCSDGLAELSLQCGACSVCVETDCPPAPAPYHPHFDTSPDYLKIAAAAKGVNGNGGSISDNYYLVVSDQGGCDGGCGDCCGMQTQVAEKMHQYVTERKESKPHSNLLFVLAGGDNFYWTGASEGRFQGTWKGVYSNELTDVPWFAVMGNHDYGNSDPTSGCPSVSPRFVCDASNAGSEACGGQSPYSHETQGYDSNQLNANKGGVDGELRAKYHMPDYTYYYAIPELDFELVAMDWNIYDIHGLGGDGPNGGAKDVYAHCGGYDALHESLSSIKDASTKILSERAKAAKSRNVAILSHYPDEFQNNQNFRKMYLQDLPADVKDTTKVFNFFGHTHNQVCRGQSDDGECVDFLAGGSGGCCSTGDLPAGFVAINFDDEKKQKVECFAPDSKCTLNAYSRSREMGLQDVPAEDVCPFTRDDPACPNYLTPGSGNNRTV